MMQIYKWYANLQICKYVSAYSRNWHEISILASHRRKPKGFTLVELLVVVAIMALLLSVVMAIFSGARTKSRDVTREEHVKTLQSALALYANNVGIYPTTAAAGMCLTGSDAVSTALISAGAISAVPLDPRHNCGTSSHYHYTASLGDTYLITYTLETDSIPGKSAGPQQAAP